MLYAEVNSLDEEVVIDIPWLIQWLREQISEQYLKSGYLENKFGTAALMYLVMVGSKH